MALWHTGVKIGAASEKKWNASAQKLRLVRVRPVILTDGPKTNAYRALVDPRDWTCGFISRADVADFLVKQIDDDAFLQKTPVLTSSLSPSRSEPTRPPHRQPSEWSGERHVHSHRIFAADAGAHHGRTTTGKAAAGIG